ncbi:MAG: beta-N-acetylhexosaminidase [Bacteroidota bacterium]|jgi:hexosaminidase
MFQKIILALVLICGVSHATYSQTELPIIPKPDTIIYYNGNFSFSNDIKIVASKSNYSVAQQWLNESANLNLNRSAHASKKVKNIILNVDAKNLTEGYILTVTANKIELVAGKKGLIRGLATITQLAWYASEHNNQIPCLQINDDPAFGYRGVHLDVSRHFFDVTFIKKYIDLIALYKMNTFHWHLVDDQGWRIEIKKYPKLTSVGANRTGSMIGPYRDHKIDSIPYGGFYTQKEIKEVIKYASARGITIIPEIEMPGHSMAALASYPEFSCKGGPFQVSTGWGGFDDVFCNKESTFKFLDDILDEVSNLFPSEYIHIGGDECPKLRWKECPVCQEVKKKNNLKDEFELQSYFIQRIEKILESKGKKLIGWDEILEGGLAQNATVMSWQGIEGGIAAATSNHYAIMTPGSHCYFDHYQGEKNLEPLAIGGFTPLEKVYAYQPIPDTLKGEQRKYILGAQANLWTEYMYDTKQVEYMLFPRLEALSEVLWSDSLIRNYPRFENKVIQHQSLLKNWNVNFAKSYLRPAVIISPTETIGELTIQIKPKENQKIDLSWNNSDYEPYTDLVSIDESGLLKIRSILNSDTVTLVKNLTIAPSSGANVTVLTPTKGNYANPPATLTDGVVGEFPWTTKHWLGWLGKDAVLTVDMKDTFAIDSVKVIYLNDRGSWIHAPASMTIQNDSVNAVQVLKNENAICSIVYNKPFFADKVYITVKSIGKVPEGNPGAGSNSWLFISEVMVYGHKKNER